MQTAIIATWWESSRKS